MKIKAIQNKKNRDKGYPEVNTDTPRKQRIPGPSIPNPVAESYGQALEMLTAGVKAVTVFRTKSNRRHGAFLGNAEGINGAHVVQHRGHARASDRGTIRGTITSKASLQSFFGLPQVG